MDHIIRAKLVKLEVDRLVDEAERKRDDPDRLEAIKAEVDVRLDALRDIHAEQLAEQLGPPPSTRHRWWQPWKTVPGSGD